VTRRWMLAGLLSLGWMGKAQARGLKKMVIEGREFDIVRVEKDGQYNYTVYGKSRVDKGTINVVVRARS